MSPCAFCCQQNMTQCVWMKKYVPFIVFERGSIFVVIYNSTMFERGLFSMMNRVPMLSFVAANQPKER